jgi:hypothetical protein
MSPKILRRCTICGKFHASYLVVDPAFGKGYLCYSCWKARQAAQPVPPAEKDAKSSSVKTEEPSSSATRPHKPDAI